MIKKNIEEIYEKLGIARKFEYACSWLSLSDCAILFEFISAQ